MSKFYEDKTYQGGVRGDCKECKDGKDAQNKAGIRKRRR